MTTGDEVRDFRAVPAAGLRDVHRYTSHSQWAEELFNKLHGRGTPTLWKMRHRHHGPTFREMSGLPDNVSFGIYHNFSCLPYACLERGSIPNVDP